MLTAMSGCIRRNKVVAAYPLHRGGSVDKRGPVGSQLSHLAVEFGIAHRPARRAAAVPDTLALLRPVGQVQRHGRRLDRSARIFFEDNQLKRSFAKLWAGRGPRV